jgi:hypothetical protein
MQEVFFGFVEVKIAVLKKGFVQGVCILFVLMWFTRAAWCDDATHEMIYNGRHNAVTRGLVSAMAVDVSGARSRAEVDQLTRQAAVRQSRLLRQRRNPQVEKIMQRLRRHRPNALPMRFQRVLVGANKGQLILPGLEATRGVKRQFGGGRLSFAFVGFTAQEEQQFRDFLSQAVPAVEGIYGLPAQSRTVTVRIEKNLAQALSQAGQSAAREIAGGFYNVSTDEILIPPLLFGNFRADALNLLTLVVRAFHGSLMFSFDAWEEGFAQAVSLIAFKRVFPDFDPLDDPFYFIQTYDMLNQPALGNSTFFPNSGFDGMTPWRIGMSLSAWLKVYAENPNFFLQFNAAYYAAFNPNDSVLLSGNVPALKQIAMGIVPMVEGLTFTDWYRRQFVLDTSISFGNKLYSFNFPENISIIVVLYSYRTEFNGDETPLQGTAALCYSNDEIDCDFNDPNSGLFAEEGNEADVVDGVGAIAPQFFNIGGENRLFIDVLVNDSRLRLTFPYGVAGQIGAFNQLFGAVLDSDEGEISLSVPGQTVQTATVSRGVFNFGSNVGVSEPTQITLQYTPLEGKTTTVVRNVGWGFYAAIFQAPPTVITVSHTFPAGTTGFHMMSLPVTPLESDEADALNIPRNRLLLARFKPDLPGDNKYELYPNFSQPLGPGVGAWLRVEQDTVVSVDGIPLPNDQDGEVELLRGFNQVGVPHNKTYTVAELRVKFRDQTFTIDQAIASGVLSQGIFGFSQAEGFKLLNNQSLFEPFQSYFIRSVQDSGVVLVFPAPAPRVLASRRINKTANQRINESTNQRINESANRRINVRRKTQDARRKTRGSLIEWKAQISAISSLAKDKDNSFGVTRGATAGLDNAYDVVQPPEIGRFVSLSFPTRNGGGVERLAYDLRAPYKGQQMWDFIVESDLSDTDVTLAWNLTGVPANVTLKLIDVDAGGKSYKMKAGGSFQFRTEEGYTLRRFRVIAIVRVKKS